MYKRQELDNGLISRETVYYDNLAFLTQIGAMGTPAVSAAGSGSVTIRVYSCPASLARPGEPELADLIAGCTPLTAAEAAPTLRLLPDGEPLMGQPAEPGVYQWHDLAPGAYVASLFAPADMQALRMTDASGAPLQNPVVNVATLGGAAEYFVFIFAEDGSSG